MGTPSCSRPPPATDNGVKDDRSNWLVAPPPSWAAPPQLHARIALCKRAYTTRKTCCSNRGSNTCPLVCQTNALPYNNNHIYIITTIYIGSPYTRLVRLYHFFLLGLYCRQGYIIIIVTIVPFNFVSNKLLFMLSTLITEIAFMLCNQK